jgi:hypothetical protein
MDKKIQKLLLSKLRQPIHIDYISKYILKVNLDETRIILNTLIDDKVIVESSYAKDYYVIQPKDL